MKGISRSSMLLRNWISVLIDPRRMFSLAQLPRYFAHWARYRQIAGHGSLRFRDSYPCLSDWTEHTPFDAHYFFQSCWTARKLQARLPDRHVDIGSSVLMVGVISAAVPTLFIDYRPVRAKVARLTSVAGDIRCLPLSDECVGSLSCMHVLEHIGLGRYGETIDPNGSVVAARELLRVLSPGGRLLISVPVGRERVEFNAHRVFAPETVIKMFGGLGLMDFALVSDNGDYFPHTTINDAVICEYGCGMFEFQKPVI